MADKKAEKTDSKIVYILVGKMKKNKLFSILTQSPDREKALEYLDNEAQKAAVESHSFLLLDRETGEVKPE